MKIAAITITYNDGYKLDEWYNLYLEYKNDIYKHIIIDNGSSAVYLSQVKKKFTNSIVVERSINGGTTAAYNDGILLALSDSEVDSIMLIGNDMKIDGKSVNSLHKFLFVDIHLGIVSPVVFKKDSDKIESVGCFVSWNLYLKEPFVDEQISNIDLDKIEVETVAGGMNLAKRKFYENIGLQDDNLFMYSDEADLGMRVKNSQYKVAVTMNSFAWHQHINPQGRSIRLPYSAFLIGRNKIYLGYKHFGVIRAWIIFLFHLYTFTKGFILKIGNKHQILYQLFFLIGSICGVLRLKRNFNFITKG